MRSALLTALLLLAALAPPAAVAHGGDEGEGEARARVACAGGRIELRLKAEEEDDVAVLEIELRVDARRGVQTLRVVVLRERRIVYGGVLRTTRAGSLLLRRTIADWPWQETITARIGTAAGRTCVLEATI